ncbi:SusC/RagA family TonB-linked outer membrane protein [Mucilaginibacter agri]|uniref:SusC/RagA family TonB-linked outer membrane protein n=1 Tax=Mucilaginibacter agri TaxID=2695265 RepID=A0A965ZGV9_9SPHI|nr:SusC/RagA family TonB-linked outer membrane protein [Mucilaginibacter agri]NCD69511.1 SusC/RagA family TonB-linked outer membrane protein [Mucilaginibacter agri]
MKKNLLILLFLSMLALTNAFAQGKKVSGKVLSADDGLPLPGVSVKIQGTQKGVLTDGDGGYSLSLTSGQVVTFSYIGFVSQSVTFNGNTIAVIKLKADSKALAEVVVTDGYTTQSKKSYAGSTVTVKGAENENKPFSTPLGALQGEVAGLNISSSSGQPGANVQVRLRGVGSIGADSNPLYVIDGMIINAGDLSRNSTTSNVLAGINENDIETIQVLKDAAATSVYGSRGSNGVIVITTKKGKAGKTVVRVDAEAGASSNLKVPESGRPVTGDEYRNLIIQGMTNAGKTQADINTYLANGFNGASNNWYDLVTKNGTQQQYNVSINGGNENTRIFSSAGYFKQEATTIGSNLTRFTGLLNIDHNISKRISLNAGINFSNVNQNTPSNGGAFANPILAAYFLRPFQLAYNADGTLNTSRSGNTNFGSVFNPLYTAANDVKNLSQTRILTNATLKWNIWDQLRYTGYGSIDYDVLEEHQFWNPIMGDGFSTGGRGYDYYTRYFNWLTRHQLDYRYNVPGIEDFYVNATVGYEAQRSQQYYINASGTGYPLTQPLLTSLANSSTPTAASSAFSNYTFDSFYSLLSANYKNKYAITGSFRRDGSSRFGTNNRFGNFWSVGGVWNVDEENFFKQQNALSSLKLRGSIGTTGNASLSVSSNPNYLARPTAGYGNNYNGGTGQNFNTIGNPDLTWESQTKFDVGADFGFFKDRLGFVVDYYRNTINQLIQQVPIARETGFTVINENVGSMLNKGLEFAVKGVPIKSKDFTWSTNFNISFNHNKVTELANHLPYVASAGPSSNSNIYVKEGYDIQTWYTRLYAGVDPANGNALWYTDGTKTATTTSYAAAARVQYKQADPKYFGGFNNTFNVYGVTLSADFYYNFGNYIQDAWASYLTDGVYYGTYGKYASNLRAWTTPGQVTDVPKYIAGGTNGGQSASFSSRFLYKGDFIRLKNLVVGYDFKNFDVVKKLGISKLYLYGRGTNLWTKTYDKNLPFDPEVGFTGQSNLEVPQIRTFTIGLNVGL